MLNNRQKTTSCKSLLLAIALCLALFLSGCGDFFEKRPTELQTEVLLNELSQVKESPYTKNTLPDIYLAPTEKLVTNDGVKLFYFTKNNPVDKIAQLIKEQLKLAVATSSATNQLIIHCPKVEDANKVEEFLKKVDVPPIQVNIDCLILERYADVTMDWETTLLLENLLGEGITLGEDKYPKAVFPGASLREIKRKDFGLDFGYWRNEGKSGHQFRVAVDMLISRGYLKVLMNPTLETVNGQPAKITSREYVPLQKIVQTVAYKEPYNLTDYQWLADVLEVTPYVYSDGSIGLKTKVQIGSRSKPEGVVQISIVTERSIEVEENRIRPGDSLIIGGIRKSEKRSVIRGVPFLKDIPVVGIAFSSKDFEEKGTEVIFILTPSISAGGIDHLKMIEDVRKKHATPKHSTGLEETLIDPLGGGAYKEHLQKEVEQAKFESFKSELEKQDAEEYAFAAKVKAEKVQQELFDTRKQITKIQTESEKIKTEAAKAKQEAEKARLEAEKLKKQEEAAQAATLKLQQQVEAAKLAHTKTQEEVARIKAQAEKLRQEAERLKVEAEKAKAEAEIAKAKAAKLQQEEEEKKKAEKQKESKAPPAKSDGNTPAQKEPDTGKKDANSTPSQQPPPPTKPQQPSDANKPTEAPKQDPNSPPK